MFRTMCHVTGKVVGWDTVGRFYEENVDRVDWLGQLRTSYMFHY